MFASVTVCNRFNSCYADAVAYRAKVPPGTMTSNAALSGKRFFSIRKKCEPNRQKFLTTFFSRLPKRLKILRYRVAASSAAPFWPVPPQIFSFLSIFTKKVHIFSRKFYSFLRKFLHFFRLAPSAPPSIGTPLCRRNWFSNIYGNSDRRGQLG